MLGYLFRSVCNIPISLLVKSKCIPDDPVVSAKIDISKPIVYAFCSRSLTEKIALHNLVTRLGLPSPFLPFTRGFCMLVIFISSILQLIKLYKDTFFFS